MNYHENPNWWDASHDFAWDHVKRTMKHHWEQTNPPDRSKVPTAFNRAKEDRIAMPCRQSMFDEWEPAFRFGFGARMEYGEEHPAWDDNLEILLAREWRRLDPAREQTWEHDREAIRYGWEFEETETGRHVVENDESSFHYRIVQPSLS
jgi:hypothetical protein